MDAVDAVVVIQPLLDARHINENDNFDAAIKPSVKVELKKRWDEVSSAALPQCHNNPNKDWFDRIYNQHNEQGRHYHTAVHLQEMLGYLQILQEADVITQEQYAPMVWATFFHDLVYDPKSSTNEKDSAKEWITFCDDLKMSEKLAQTVNTMILATEKHQLLPMIDPAIALAQAYFLDLDMAVLGKTQGAYLAYAGLIRREYSFVAHDVYCSKRAEILQKFLETANIYQTTIFRKAMEKRARANLHAEIELLQQGIIPAGLDEVQGTFHVWDVLLYAVSTMNLPPTTGRTRNRTTAVAVTVLLAILFSTFLNHHVVDASTVTALSSSRRSLPSSQRRTSAASHNHNHHHHANCDGRPHIPAIRHACGLFLWDAPSALLYKWCNYLLKDHIYEGRGGYLFVRYESNSILQLLYPCTRYAPNRCVFCGGSFPDHLLLWWSKNHLYSPFDQYLDKTYNDALTLLSFETIATKDSSTSSKRSSRSSSIGRSSHQKKQNFPPPPPQVMEEAPTFQFHKRYVEDVTHLAEIDDETQKLPAFKQWLDIKRRINNNNDPKSKMALKVGYVPLASMVYVAEIPDSSLPTKGGGPPRSFQTMVGNFVAGIALNAVEDLIELQHRENKKRKEDAYKRSRSPFRL